MRLKKVSLKNIRSYVEAAIEFPEGSTLLSGNIGSGKTTVLLAVEFALFGILKGNVSGAALLRNGADHGIVEVTFSVNDKDVKVCRRLKRSGDSVAQEAGYLEVDGMHLDATALELKQKVLEILQYPQDLLMKNKALIYRYTVYTPQEEMKYVLQCDKEERLDILRRVFGIDKYKRVANNAKILVQYLKEKKRDIAAVVADIPEMQEQIMKTQQGILQAQQAMKETEAFYLSMREQVLRKQEEIVLLDESIRKYLEIKRKKEVQDALLTQAKRRSITILDECALLEKQLSVLREEVAGFTDRSVQQEILAEKGRLSVLEKELQGILLQMHEIKIKKEQAQQLSQKISSLNLCPTCLQEVGEAHKHRFLQTEEEKVKALESLKLDIGQRQQDLQHQFTLLKERIDLLMKEEAQLELKKWKFKHLKEKEQRLAEVSAETNSLSKEMQVFEIQILQLQTELNASPEMEILYLAKKDELKRLLTEEKDAHMKKVSKELQAEALQKEAAVLQRKIAEKEILRKKLDGLQKMQFWVEEQFLQLMQSMETSIMLKVHAEFSSFFEKWFGMLVEKDVLHARLDTSFSPVIEQNGYEIDFEFLSGGEKTAAALAYRLALNQVINNVVGVIATKNLIILDEPTDGFSSEQLDRLRIVLDELQIGQVILVSHEPKIESFVNNVLRFEKQEHTSAIFPS